MFERIETMRMARALTDHAAQRQGVVARNIANADTPDYRARDVRDFAETYRAPMGGEAMKSTRAGHLPDPFWPGDTARLTVDAAPISPNGNSVSVEDEMVKMARMKREHDLSLAIYKSSMDLMRVSIGKRV